ncbi:hypothetical protein [Alterisphingorhabdus coralli]|uniref:Uncharacterized protein n=1 Tax=Alterisphingorhabdus coralli TaxID=3071408 RepID=A0AA97FA29_9SPHN|nr:hypothetical protein [Parasphingorhabdus sp. SCSIO 66989]WOE76341.1 hypothetical protein RB602_06410 [Parasphingorhabdus sp. SCSIO 66989]
MTQPFVFQAYQAQQSQGPHIGSPQVLARVHRVTLGDSEQRLSSAGFHTQTQGYLGFRWHLAIEPNGAKAGQ